MIPKTTSYGTLIFNEHRQLLVAHVTGNSHWDIPKGGGDPGEPPIDSALRELREETGIVLPAHSLKELGHTPYILKKDLHLFMAHVKTSDIDITKCECSSYFPHHVTGELTKETDDFAWLDHANVTSYCAKGLALLLLKMYPKEFPVGLDT